MRRSPSTASSAPEAIAEGRFDRSVVPIRNDDGTVALDHDEFPRPGTTLESLAKLPPQLREDGRPRLRRLRPTFDDTALPATRTSTTIDHVHHAGNSSGVVDGASADAPGLARVRQAHGLAPRAKIVMSAVAGAEPVIMLTAPGPASTEVPRPKAGMTVDDIDLWEINEAFAAVVLKSIRTSTSTRAVNVNGGAMALGHPIGATGAMLIQTALDELERRDCRTGLVTMCTGGGMGTATIIERV